MRAATSDIRSKARRSLGSHDPRRDAPRIRPTRAADEEPCARRILTTLARRAYRRPVTDEDRRALMAFYTRGRAQGFEAGIGLALERMLAGPEFLFRIEREGPFSELLD